MINFPIEELVERIGSRYALVVAAAKRARQLKDGAPPLVNVPTRNVLTIALHEIAAGLVEISAPPPEALQPPKRRRAEEPPELAAPVFVETLLEHTGRLTDSEEELKEELETEFDEEEEQEELIAERLLDEEEEALEEDWEEDEEFEEGDWDDDWDNED